MLLSLFRHHINWSVVNLDKLRTLATNRNSTWDDDSSSLNRNSWCFANFFIIQFWLLVCSPSFLSFWNMNKIEIAFLVAFCIKKGCLYINGKLTFWRVVIISAKSSEFAVSSWTALVPWRDFRITFADTLSAWRNSLKISIDSLMISSNVASEIISFFSFLSFLSFKQSSATIQESKVYYQSMQMQYSKFQLQIFSFSFCLIMFVTFDHWNLK